MTGRRSEQIAELRNHVVALARRLKQSARGSNESWTALMALGAIERARGAATPTEIGAELELRSSNLAQVLGELDQRGLIRRDPDPSDKRKARLSITAAGLAVVRASRAVRDRWLADAMAECLSSAERAQLLAAGDLIRRVTLWSQSAPAKSE